MSDPTSVDLPVLNELSSLAIIVATGLAAQLLAWRIKIPSILMLLVAGFVLGPVTGLVSPDALAGDLLMPVVALAVAIILFEGGLSLKFSEIKETGPVVWRLVTLGSAVTMILVALATHFTLGWSWGISFLLGAIFTVTGPTVIAPLLRHVRPSKQVGSVLKWEGIVIDPIGAMLALIVFEIVAAGGLAGSGVAFSHALLISLKVIGIGGLIGLLGAGILYFALKRYWIPDYLQSPITLALTVGSFALSDHLQHEAGLVAVTAMGIALANQRSVKTAHILEFKENLRVLLISVLFIVLAARLSREQLDQVPWAASVALLFILVLIRPIGVYLSTIGSPLLSRERAFLAGIAPRGIVAAAVASVFADRLAAAGIPGADQLVPVTFFLIVGTVAIYGLGASPLAKALKVSSAEPQGILFAGATPLIRAIAETIKDGGIRTLVVDTNRSNISAAKLAGIDAHSGSIISGEIEEELNLVGIGRLIAMTPNPEINSLASIHFRHHFGTENIYSINTEASSEKMEKKVAAEFRSRTLFSDVLTYDDLDARFRGGSKVKKTNITEEFTYENFFERNTVGNRPPLPLFLITAEGKLRIFAADAEITPKAGDQIIALITPGAEVKNTQG